MNNYVYLECIFTSQVL